MWFNPCSTLLTLSVCYIVISRNITLLHFLVSWLSLLFTWHLYKVSGVFFSLTRLTLPVWNLTEHFHMMVRWTRGRSFCYCLVKLSSRCIVCIRCNVLLLAARRSICVEVILYPRYAAMILRLALFHFGDEPLVHRFSISVYCFVVLTTTLDSQIKLTQTCLNPAWDWH